MKKSTRILACALSVAMLAALCVGCGNKNPNVSDDGRVIVSEWNGNTHMRTVLDAVVAEWNESEGKDKNILWNVEWKEGGTITQNIEVALQTGNAPDLISSGDFLSFVENGYITAVSDIPGGEEIIAEFDDQWFIEEHNMLDGKIYSLPTGATTQGMVYNKDMFKAAGIVDENGEPTPPKTWDEYRAYAKKLTNPGKNEYGTIFPMKWGGIYGSDVSSPAMRSQGYQEYDPATGKYDFSCIAKIAQYWVDMKNDGSLFPGSEGLDNDPARARFSEGGIGMKMGFSFDVGVFNDQFPAQIDWGVAHYPVLDENEVYGSRMDVGHTGFVNAASADRFAQIIEVVKYRASKDYVRRMYIDGVSLPYDFSIVADIELPETAKKGWKEFAALTDGSYRVPMTLQYDTSATIKPADVFVNEVWTGNKTADAAFAEVTAEINAAVEEYYKNYPEKKDKHYAARVIPDWNIKIQ